MSTRTEQIAAIVAEYGGIHTWLRTPRMPRRWLAVFNGELRDYDDEGHRAMNVPDDAILYDWNPLTEEYEPQA
jgi:hypothetical protein